MPVAVIDGQPLHYLDLGNGPAVLLGSSYLWDRDMWAPQIEALSQQYRVLVPELWGHGESGPLPASTRSLDDLARQALALLDQLEIAQVNLVGLSVGGMWGARLALQAPGRVNSLVLMDTYLGAEPEATRQYYFSLFKMIEDTGAIPEPLLDVIAPIFFRPGIDRESALYQDYRRALQSFSRERLLHSIVPLGRLIFSRSDVLEQLPRLDADTTLVMCGEQDKPRPPAESDAMAKLIGCSLTLIPDAGHISSRENPDFVNEALLTFLANLALSPCLLIAASTRRSKAEVPHHPLQLRPQLRQLDARRGVALHTQCRLIGTRADAGDATIDLFGHRALLLGGGGDLLVHLLDQ